MISGCKDSQTSADVSSSAVARASKRALLAAYSSYPQASATSSDAQGSSSPSFPREVARPRRSRVA